MIRIAMVQVASPDSEAPERRRSRVGEMVMSAMGADLVVLPELWAPGYFAFDQYESRAEPLEGPTVAAARDWARALGAHVHLGSFLERTITGALHNTAVLVDPAGQIVHTYRKVHVFGYQSLEARLLTPGGSVSVAHLPELGPVGATTCYDLRFPEIWRALVDAGAHMVIVPAAWPAARKRHWQLFTATRAVEEQVVVVACNGVGTQGGTRLGGHSRLVDPWGEVVVEADDSEGVFVGEVSATVVADTRGEFRVLADRVSRIGVTPSGPPVPSAAGSTVRSPDEPSLSPSPDSAVGPRLVTTTGSEFTLESPTLLVAGYTGRDEALVRAHIDELAAIGVPPPETVPSFYLLPAELLTTDTAIEVGGANTSGEAEPVLICHRGEFYLGVGSDHTDRDVERDSVAASKAACPKPLAATVIPVPADPGLWAWDQVGLSSTVDGLPYQNGNLEAIRPPGELVELLRQGPGEPGGDWVMFLGTVPLLGGDFVPGAHWQVTLSFADDTDLTHSYKTAVRRP